MRLLERGARRELTLHLVVQAAADILHRVMVLEILAEGTIQHSADVVSYLKRHPQAVQLLSRYKTVLRDLKRARVNILPLSYQDLHANAIVRGVQDGIFGYSAALQIDADGHPFIADHRLVKISVPLTIQEVDLSTTSYLIAPELALRLALPPQSSVPEPMIYPASPAQSTSIKEHSAEYEGSTVPAATTPRAAVTSGRRYRLRFTANKQQLFRAFRPLQNLAEKSGTLEVTLDVIAHADTPLDASWLRNAVEEPLDEADVSFDGTLEA